MSVLEKLKRILFVMGSFFASLFLSISVITTPVFADPTTSTTSDTTSTTETSTSDTSSDSSTTQTTDTCYDESGSLGWLVCPSTGFLAKATDALYGIIEDFLVVEPLSSDTDNPFHQVWEIFRDITNIVFVIFLLIVIYSQLTGVGISNYGIKKVLPKIIVSAILINLSYIICALFVDLSNIIGASLKGLFSGIESSVTATGMLAAAGSSSTELSYSAIVGALLGTVAIGGIAIGAAGGLGYLFFSLIPVLLGAVVAVFIAFITISARQAFVYLLIMISPLAFVCSLLPNTEKWFDQWKKSLTSMLFFYPMFSALFGACSLVGWVIIASAEKPIMLVFGMAIKVVPLFMSWSLLKMSGTLPGQISAALTNLTRRPLGAISNATRDAANLRRAEYTARKMQQPFNFASGGSWRARNLQRRYNRQARLKTLEAQTQGLLEEERMARLEGKRIVGRTGSGAPIYAKEISGYDNNGKPIYRDRVNETKELRSEFTAREIGLRNAASKARIDNVMSTMGTYLEQNGVVVDSEFGGHIHQQGQNYLELMTQAQAKRRNDIADKRFYANSVREAAKTDRLGNIIDQEAYDRLITRGAGADAYVSASLSGEALREARMQRNAALRGVEADAIDAIEAERRTITSKYTTYMSKLVTKDVLKVYEEMLEQKDIEGICAAQNTLAMRGDYDKIGEKLQEYMDREGYVELGSDFANTLALNLLSMRAADPKLGRLGKHINVETWAYTDWDETSGKDRRASYVTMKEFYTGTSANGVKTKYYAPTLMQGTSVKDIDRTFYADLQQDIEKYYTAENFGSTDEAEKAKKALIANMMPQIISAVPSYAAGSEPLINTMNFLTGAKYDGVADVWYPEWMEQDASGAWHVKAGKHPESASTAAERLELTKKYLGAMTPNDVINMKTDAFNSTMLRLKLANGYDFTLPESDASNQAATTAAIDAFRAIFDHRGSGVIERLRASNPNVLVPMKKSVKQALGL
ncbi:hypothetical protein IJH46_00685 [Candidatus Saccharibacteria bacterium]|nr:hypothetical protein [Candidatus Saccharibacteria bacterium]